MIYSNCHVHENQNVTTLVHSIFVYNKARGIIKEETVKTFGSLTATYAESSGTKFPLAAAVDPEPILSVVLAKFA